MNLSQCFGRHNYCVATFALGIDNSYFYGTIFELKFGEYNMNKNARMKMYELSIQQLQVDDAAKIYRDAGRALAINTCFLGAIALVSGAYQVDSFGIVGSIVGIANGAATLYSYAKSNYYKKLSKSMSAEMAFIENNSDLYSNGCTRDERECYCPKDCLMCPDYEYDCTEDDMGK